MTMTLRDLLHSTRLASAAFGQFLATAFWWVVVVGVAVTFYAMLTAPSHARAHHRYHRVVPSTQATQHQNIRDDRYSWFSVSHAQSSQSEATETRRSRLASPQGPRGRRVVRAHHAEPAAKPAFKLASYEPPDIEAALFTRCADRGDCAHQKRIVSEPMGDLAITTVPDIRTAQEIKDVAAGIVRSKKTGAIARIAHRHQPKFQAYIDGVEAAGGAVYYMGGYRAGHCSIGSQHPCGEAIDVCQDSRGHVSGARDCHLPSPEAMAALARANNLYEGGEWCHTDYGHVQARPSGGHCPPKGWIGDGKGRYLASITGKIELAAASPRKGRQYNRARYASNQSDYGATHYQTFQ